MSHQHQVSQEDTGDKSPVPRPAQPSPAKPAVVYASQLDSKWPGPELLYPLPYPLPFSLSKIRSVYGWSLFPGLSSFYYPAPESAQFGSDLRWLHRFPKSSISSSKDLAASLLGSACSTEPGFPVYSFTVWHGAHHVRILKANVSPKYH